MFQSKKCLMCGREFTPHSSQQKFCIDCRPLARKKMYKDYRDENQETRSAYQKVYRIVNKECLKASHHDYYEVNMEKIKVRTAAYGQDHPVTPEKRQSWPSSQPANKKLSDAVYYAQHREEIIQNVKEWVASNPEKASLHSRKQNAKHRTLGFIPLNEPFPGSEGHHVDREHVRYMLKELHRSIPHNVWTGKNMERINALAYEVAT